MSIQSYPPAARRANTTYRLDNATRIVLEHNFLHLAAYDVHELHDIFSPLLFGEVELACIRPDAFGMHDDLGIGFGGFALRIKCFLDLV